MFKQTLCRAALGLALSAALGVVSSAQEADVANYARGANYFSVGAYAEAGSVFDRMVASKTDDPRVYFFRGLCATRQNDATTAAAFYAEGARLELATEKGRLSNVDEALKSIQGEERIPIEDARSTARAEWKANESARQKALYGESLAAQRARLATPPKTTAATDDATAAPQNDASSVAPIRPFSRTETPANRVPDLYDKNSDAFKYFREDLGKTELSTKTKARLAALAARVVYDDPMDKPAADGSPFVNIYGEAEIFSDGKPFVGDDDPDVVYEADEKNVLNSIAESCELASAAISAQLGAQSQSQNTANAPYGGTFAPPSEPVAIGSGGVPLGPGASAGPGSGSSSDSKAAEKNVEPSASDDTKLLFEDAKPADSSFNDKISLDANNDFDLFQSDRDFKPVATSSGSASGSAGFAGPGPGMPMPTAGTMGPDATSGAAPSSDK